MRNCDYWSLFCYRYEVAPDVLFEWIELLILTGVQTCKRKQNIVTENFRGFFLCPARQAPG